MHFAYEVCERERDGAMRAFKLSCNCFDLLFSLGFRVAFCFAVGVGVDNNKTVKYLRQVSRLPIYCCVCYYCRPSVCGRDNKQRYVKGLRLSAAIEYCFRFALFALGVLPRLSAREEIRWALECV